MLRTMYLAGQRRAKREAREASILNATNSGVKAAGAAVTHSVIDATLSVPGTLWTYVVGNKFPISVPSVEACLSAWTTGWLNTVDTAAVCRWQGADVPLPGRLRSDAAIGEDSLRMQRAWDAVLSGMQQVVSTDGVMELWKRGELTDAELKESLRRNGILREDVAAALVTLAQPVPEVDDIVPAWQHGLITRAEAKDLLSRRGIQLERFENLWFADSVTVSPDSAIEFARRVGLDDQATREVLQRTGVFDEGQQNILLTLFSELPNRTDVTHWLMRNVFDQQYVTDFRLDEGFEERYWSRFETIFNAQGWSKDYAYLDYAAHWIVPAVGQLAEMVQRLRPGRVPAGLAFTRDDFLRVLAEQDIAPFFRDRLLATAYRPLSIRFIRTLFQTEQTTEGGVQAAYEDLGYSEADARTIVGAENVLKARQRAAASRGWTPAAISQAVVTGQMTADQANVNMHALGFTSAETKAMLERAQLLFQGRLVARGQVAVQTQSARALVSAYIVGTATAEQTVLALTGLGWQLASASAVVAALEVQERTKQAARVIGAVKRQFLKGHVTLAQAQQVLVTAGLAAPRIAQITSEWPLELTPARKSISAGAIRKGLLQGLINATDAEQALKNLGYSDPDSFLLASEFAFDVRDREVKAKKAADRNAVQAAKMFEQLLERSAALDRRMRAGLRRATPVAKLQLWFAQCWIDEASLTHRLKLMGYSDDTIGLYLNEARDKRDKLAASKNPSAACAGQAPAANGTAGGNP